MTSAINCFIIDDDQGAISILEDQLSGYPRLKVHSTYTKPVDALNKITMEKPGSIIFMDIDMPLMSGIRLAETLRSRSHHVIFTTSYPHYAIQAFKVRARHYLLKPYGPDELAEVVNDVLEEYYNPHQMDSITDDAFFIRTSNDRRLLRKILISDIIYLQGANNHVHFYLPEEDFSVFMTLKEMEDILQENPYFFRVHKSYIINRSFMKQVIGNTVDLGKYKVLMTLPYKKNFMEYVARNTLVSKRV